MRSSRPSLRWSVAALVLLAAACQDAPAPTEPGELPGPATVTQEARGFANAAISEVMALPQTVFGGLDQATGQMVFGVEREGVARGIETVMARRGIPASSWSVRVTEPIHFAATLRDRHRPTMGGLQIHWGNYVCTLGFSVDHAGGRSFITNSHCTDQQGSTGSTTYYQPLSSVDSNPIGVEAHDPAYFKGGDCSRGKKCRYSDASRALYQSGVGSLGEIAKTAGGVNSGDLTASGSFDITGQSSSRTFSGTIHKVGRTTGWTSGTVTDSCVTVNVFGSNIQLLCQTFVENPDATIVLGGDSGSPVFTPSGSNTATLVGILWGGSSSGDLFVFSPLEQIQDELGTMNATTDGVGGDGGEPDPEPEPDPDEPNCPPNSNSPKCR